MHKSILVLEESLMVHDLFESALPDELKGWKINHETLPDKYIQKAKVTNPDIIFISNQDQKRDYAMVRKLKSMPDLDRTPILLLTSAKDKLDEEELQDIGIRGFVRKPFETSTLQRQINTVLKEIRESAEEHSKDELRDVNVVDDELMELLAGKRREEMSIDELEGELDPTLQLIPEDVIQSEEMEETELVSMDADSDSFEQADFIVDDTELDDNADAVEIIEVEEESTEDFDTVELDEIDEDYDFTDADDSFEMGEIESTATSIIEVIQADSPLSGSELTNTPENGRDPGIMEVDIVPFRSKSPVSDMDEEEFVREHSPVELEPDVLLEEVSLDSDEIVIPHEEIVEDFDEGFDEEEDDLEQEDLMEISVEGMEDTFADTPASEFQSDEERGEKAVTEPEIEDEEPVIFEELEDEEGLMEENDIGAFDLSGEDEDSLGESEDIVMVEQEKTEAQPIEPEELEQESSIDLEIDFEEDQVTFGGEETEETDTIIEDEDLDEDLMGDPDEDFPEDDREKEEREKLDIDLEEIAAAGTDEASSTIQEMIGFRQVMKAKYEIPEDHDTAASDEEEWDPDEEPDLLAAVEEGEQEEEDSLSGFDSLQDSFEPDEDDELELLDAEAEPDEDEPMFSEDLPDLDNALEEFDEIDETEELILEHEADSNSYHDDDLDEIDLLSEEEPIEEPELPEEDASLELEDDKEAEDSFEEIDLIHDEEEEDLFEDLEPPEEETTQDDDSAAISEEEDSFEEIELLSADETDEDDQTSLLEDGEPESVDQFSIDDEGDDLDSAIESGEEIDFMAIEEEEPEEMNSGISIDEPDEAGNIDNIDFLPVEEEDTESAEDDASIDDIDFLPVEEEAEEEEVDTEGAESAVEEEELPEEEDIPTDDIRAMEDADEITIEVPQETFEMGDFNLRDIEDDEEPDDALDEVLEEERTHDRKLMQGIGTEADDTFAEQMEEDEEADVELESINDMEIPSMDEDLPDLPPILDSEDENIDQNKADQDEYTESEEEIQMLQSEDDFDGFPSEENIIGIVDKEEKSSLEPSEREASIADPHAPSQTTEEIRAAVESQMTKSVPPTLSQEFRDKLSTMIEGVISETVHNKLHEILPDMVDKLIHEELKDKKDS